MRLLLENTSELWPAFNYDWGFYVEFFTLHGLLFSLDLAPASNLFYLPLGGDLVQTATISTALLHFLALDSVFAEWLQGGGLLSIDYLWYSLEFFSSYNLFVILFLFYIGFICYYLLAAYGTIRAQHLSLSNLILSKILLVWVYSGWNKMESLEESICLVFLWPWCIFIIFLHLFSMFSLGTFFGFAEWGLPVVYGLLLLLEHFFNFGVYIAVYLVGARGRRNVFAGWLEDIASSIIMLSRVMLQAVRGIIVGMFHFIAREASLSASRWRIYEAEFSSNAVEASSSTSMGFDIILFALNAVLVLVIIAGLTAIMFLQLIFLMVSVWLFCKCWFISWLGLPSGSLITNSTALSQYGRA